MANATKKFTKASQMMQEQGYEVLEEEKKKEAKAPEIPKVEVEKKPEEKPTESQAQMHKPEYGDFTTFTFERTVSIRQFEPFRIQATYRVGKDDLLSDIVKKSKDFNTAIEEAYHVSTQPPLPQDQDVNRMDHPAYARQQEAQPQAQTQHPMGGAPPPLPTMSYPDADTVSEASEKQIRKCYAVWHQMGEPSELKPSGKWSRKQASDYIDKYDKQAQNQGGYKPFPTPEERGYRTRFY